MKTGQDLNDAISEHQHLVKVLRSTSHDDDRREAKKQAAELKTLRRKKVRDGLPAKPAPEAYPGVELGDSLYIHHQKRGPIAVKVHAQGRHGITATDSEGRWHRAKWQHVLGAKQRLSQRLTLVDQGEDGAITEDESGQRRYVAIDPEARPDQEPLRKSQPTAAQIEAGNYRKDHQRFQGLDISIENPKGSIRAGTDPTGKPWRITMRHAYGYIRGTCGVDKDHVDCYLGPNPDASHAYVVHQRQAGKWSRYDEDKVMLGFDSAADAKAAYLAQYDDPRFFGNLTAMPMADFKRKALATRQHPRMIKALILFLKAHIPGYTKQDGTFVAPHEDKRAPAKAKPDPPASPITLRQEGEKWIAYAPDKSVLFSGKDKDFVERMAKDEYEYLQSEANTTSPTKPENETQGQDEKPITTIGQAVMWYQNYGYQDINDHLRGKSANDSVNPRIKAAIDLLDEAFKKQPRNGFFAYRGDGAAISIDLFKTTGIAEELQAILPDNSKARRDATTLLRLKTRKGQPLEEFLNDQLVGTVISDDGFASASTDKDLALHRFAHNGGELTHLGALGVAEILGRNVKSLNVDQYSVMDAGEGERLLPRGCRYTIKRVSIEAGDNGAYLHYQMEVEHD